MIREGDQHVGWETRHSQRLKEPPARIAETSLRILGKEAELIEKTRPRTEELPETATPEAPTALDVPVDAPGNGVPSAPTNGRRAQLSEEESIQVEPVAIEETPSGSGESSEAVESNNAEDPDREARRMARSEERQIARAEKRRRPRAPLAEKMAAPSDSASPNEDDLPEDSPPAADDFAATGEDLAGELSGENTRSASRAARRAQNKQAQAEAALNDADDHPAIGALNRHLNMLMQELGTAHRVIGRVAAERDAFRQQLADLQGIPVEAIAVTSLGQTRSRRPKAQVDQSADLSESPVEGIAVASPGRTRSRRSKTTDSEQDEPSPPSGMARLNYFSVDDIAVARKRRQTLALVLLVAVVGLWLASRMGAWHMPENLSRDSLAQLPVVGELMSYFLAGWVMYRIVRVSGRGVKWVFPSDQKRKRS
jgi:hypothetical protein